jgi:hypothetical protein
MTQDTRFTDATVPHRLMLDRSRGCAEGEAHRHRHDITIIFYSDRRCLVQTFTDEQVIAGATKYTPV